MQKAYSRIQGTFEVAEGSSSIQCPLSSYCHGSNGSGPGQK